MIKEKSIEFKVHNPKMYGLENSTIKNGDIIKLDVNKLPYGSHIKIIAICDNCQKEKLTEYRIYVKIFNKNNHYYCKKCSCSIDCKETCLKKYGVDNVMKVQEYKNKMYDTNLNRYGHICSVQSESIKPKALKSIYEKLGTYNVFQSQEILNKVRIKKELKGLQSSNILKSNFQKYRELVDKLTRLKRKILFENWDGTDYYDNEYIKNNFDLDYTNDCYPNVDHKISCLYGFLNNISAEIISDMQNLCITKRINNIHKHIKSEEKFLIELKNKNNK
jgi:hypothetical protein